LINEIYQITKIAPDKKQQQIHQIQQLIQLPDANPIDALDIFGTEFIQADIAFNKNNGEDDNDDDDDNMDTWTIFE
jgi:hypothetical protein